MRLRTRGKRMIRIMVVDDERFVRNGIIQGTDWKSINAKVVAEAENGKKGLDLALNTDLDLIISDIRMPFMDGVEMVRRIREVKPDLAVIYLTAYDDFEYAREAIRMGVSDYLLKPFDDGALEQTIQRLVDQKRIIPDSQEEDERVPLPQNTDVMHPYVQNAIAYIQQHYADAEELNVNGIAEAIGVSEGHLSRLFKTETGISVHTYVSKYRMRKAMVLLRDPKRKVYEVAAEVGYTDITHFSSSFKKIVGITPSEYQAIGR